MMQEDTSPFAPRSIADFRQDLDTSDAETVMGRLEREVEAAAGWNAVIAADLAGPGNQISGPGILAGIPFGVKDNIDALPFATTGGSPALAGYVPAEDAPPVAQLRAAGAVPVLKLSLHEFAFGVTSNNGLHGPVRNPFDRERVAGGSSGGSGVAIALGLVPVALGTDTGGSVRIPAAFCGICGFRPSTGRYSEGGVLTISRTRDTVGVMASCVDDIVTADRIITGASEELEGLPELADRPLRIGIGKDVRAGLCAAVDDTLTDTINRLEGAGCELVAIDTAGIDEAADAMGFPIAFNEALEFWQDFLATKHVLSYEDFTARIASPDVKQIFTSLPDLATSTKVPFDEAIAIGLDKLKGEYTSLFQASGIDVIVTSTVPVQSPRIGEDETFEVDGRAHPTFQTLVRHTTRASVIGAPSLSIPAGFDRDGLPVGLQIDGPLGEDGLVLTAGRHIEQILRP